MNNQILASLKNTLENLPNYESIGAETKNNTLKEELQFYVLNFIYNHPEYSTWVMYGGSVLRKYYNLDRMSVDLDFEVDHEVEREFLSKLKKDIEAYFRDTYMAQGDFLSVSMSSRGLTLKFNRGKELSFGYSSNWTNIKIDLNFFVAPKKIVIESIPRTHNQMSFIIRTYNLSALMASKIAAIFLRGQRGVGKNTYDYKGRDIYDLIWYMNKKVVPDFDYLIAKGVDMRDPKELFDRLTTNLLNYEKMDELLKTDLTPLFLDQTLLGFWLKNWKAEYLRLLKEYKINTVTTLENIKIHQDFNTDNFSFHYRYRTDEGSLVRVTYTISDFWIDFKEGDLTIETDKKLDDKIEFTSNGLSSRPAPKNKLKQYATLFHQKTEKYFDKTNHIVLGDKIATKIVRMTLDNLNYKEQIFLHNKSVLEECELDDLLK